MTPETRAALEQSIVHHERMLEDKAYAAESGLGADACALCREYYADRCRGCPIPGRVGAGYCHRTPYGTLRDANVTWYGAYERGSEDEPAFWAKRQEAERAEIEFLRSLLPEGE
jgi:hypothetical protein